MSDEFQQIVTVAPAFDCVVVQPCVHGSKRCGKDPGATHGRHNAEMRIILRNELAEVILVVNTGWYLPETPAFVGGRDDDRSPRPALVEFHSAVPMYEGDEPQGTRCDLWPKCYGNTGYTIADEPTAMLVSKGLDAVWEWLKAEHRERFGARTDLKEKQ
jgi:hypothetical protein